ncbi:MAG: hypothetical protein Q8Q03_00905 [bacterium]|nr:hypothetical protein [bacterium]
MKIRYRLILALSGVLIIFSSPVFAQSPSPSSIYIPVPESRSAVNDEVAFLTQKILIKNEQLAQLKDDPRDIPISQERKILMKDLAQKNAGQFLKVRLDKKILSQLTPQAQKNIERRGIINGNLDVRHIDDFNNNRNSRFEYTLVAPNQKYKIFSPTEVAPKKQGKARADAYTLDNIMVLAQGDPSLIPLAGQGSRDAVGNQKLLVLITEMTGAVSPITIDDAKKVILSPEGQFQKYFSSQSYSKAWFTGKVYKIRVNRVAEGCTSGVSISDPDIINEIKLQNINLANFDRVLFIPPNGRCSGVGRGEYEIDGKIYNLSQSWVGWSDIRFSLDSGTLSKTLAHEIGHALGVFHANFLSCDENESCTHQEYGNYFDMMGYGSGDFNVFYKEQLNWLTSSDFLNINSSGDYIISPLESGTGIKAAKVVNPKIGPLSVMYLETRANLTNQVHGDVAAGQNNSLLLNIPERPSKLTETAVELIDMAPNAWNRVGLIQGDEDFTPYSSGVTIGSVAHHEDEVKFHVEITKPVCNSKPPRIIKNQQEYIPKLTLDSTVGIGTEFANDDPVCLPPSGFVIVLTDLPEGWIEYPQNSDQIVNMISPREQAYASTVLVIPPSASPGIYTLNYEVKNLASGKTAKGSSRVEVIPKPKIISIDPSPAEIGRDIIIVGTDFTSENRVVFGIHQNGEWHHSYFETVFPVTMVGTRQGEQTLIIRMPETLCVWNGKETICDYPALSGNYYVYVQTENGTTDFFYFPAKNPNDVSKIDITSPTFDDVMEKGKSYIIKYKAEGVLEMQIDLMNFKGNKIVDRIGVINPNVFGEHKWQVPEYIDLDRDDIFIIRISDANNPKLHSDSGKFMITEKNEPSMEILSSDLAVEYDSDQKESSLVSKTKVMVIAPRYAELVIPDKNAFSAYAVSTLDGWAFGDVKYSSNALKIGSFYRVKKGASATFDLTTRFNIKIMFAGSYASKISGLAYGRNYEGYKIAPDNSSNPVVIVGETSPYIQGSTKPAYINKPVTIKGVRFGIDEMDMYINKFGTKVMPKSDGDVDSITFDLNDYKLDPGYIMVQVANKEGLSNIYYMELLSTKSTQGALILNAFKSFFKLR